MRASIGFTAIAVLLLVVAGVLGLTQLAIARHNPCRIYGDMPTGARFSDSRAGVVETWSLWPLGSTCYWPRADGNGMVESHVGSVGPTLSTYGFVAGGIVAAGLAVRASRRDEDRGVA